MTPQPPPPQGTPPVNDVPAFLSRRRGYSPPITPQGLGAMLLSGKQPEDTPDGKTISEAGFGILAHAQANAGAITLNVERCPICQENHGEQSSISNAEGVVAFRCPTTGRVATFTSNGVAITHDPPADAHQQVSEASEAPHDEPVSIPVPDTIAKKERMVMRPKKSAQTFEIVASARKRLVAITSADGDIAKATEHLEAVLLQLDEAKRDISSLKIESSYLAHIIAQFEMNAIDQVDETKPHQDDDHTDTNEVAEIELSSERVFAKDYLTGINNAESPRAKMLAARMGRYPAAYRMALGNIIRGSRSTDKKLVDAATNEKGLFYFEIQTDDEWVTEFLNEVGWVKGQLNGGDA